MRKKTTEWFIEQSKLLNGDRYLYHNTLYKGYHNLITITCKTHGDYEISVINHLNGKGHCIKCTDGRGQKLNTQSFIEKVSVKHCNKYDYSKVNYKTIWDKIIIICPKHGEFSQTAHDHMTGRGCRKCRNSKMENIIRAWLDKNNITYEHEKTFETCRGKQNMLPFDFYLPTYNLLIEYDGEQHELPWANKFNHRVDISRVNDAIKTKWALDNNIKLLRISYKDKKSATSIIAAALLTIQR